MRRWVVLIMVVSAMLPGCAAKTVQDVGVGMQIGSAGGTPLAPLVLGAGIITEVAGKLAGAEGDGVKPLHDKSMQEGREEIVLNHIYILFRSKLNPTPLTTSDAIEVNAKAVCADIDKIAAKDGFIKVNRDEVNNKMTRLTKFMPEGDEEEFQLPMSKNPFNNCIDEFKVRGKNMVAFEIIKANRRK